MSHNPESPLTDADRENINNRLADNARLSRDIEMAVAAGCPLSDQSDHCNHIRERLEKIKRVYFPNGP
jgi:hypothetical protein